MKLPDDAFERYVALGPDRSYQLLAEKLGKCPAPKLTTRSTNASKMTTTRKK